MLKRTSHAARNAGLVNRIARMFRLYRVRAARKSMCLGHDLVCVFHGPWEWPVDEYAHIPARCDHCLAAKYLGRIDEELPYQGGL